MTRVGTTIRRSTRGFTLVELMTVSFILAMIMGAIMATFTIGNRSMKTADERVELRQTAHLVFGRLERELSSLWVPPTDPDPGQTLAVMGDVAGTGGITDDASGITGAGDLGTDAAAEELTPAVYGEPGDMSRDESPRIEFLTVLPPEFGTDRHRVDVVQLVYFVDTDPQTPEEGLIRGVNRYVDLGEQEETTELEVMTEHVTAMEIQYFNPESEDWEDAWESQDVPLAILFTITFDDDEDDEEPLILTGTVTPPDVLSAPVGEAFMDTQAAGGGDGTEDVPEDEMPSEQDMQDMIDAAEGAVGP